MGGQWWDTGWGTAGLPVWVTSVNARHISTYLHSPTDVPLAYPPPRATCSSTPSPQSRTPPATHLRHFVEEHELEGRPVGAVLLLHLLLRELPARVVVHVQRGVEAEQVQQLHKQVAAGVKGQPGDAAASRTNLRADLRGSTRSSTSGSSANGESNAGIRECIAKQRVRLQGPCSWGARSGLQDGFITTGWPAWRHTAVDATTDLSTVMGGPAPQRTSEWAAG